MNYAKKMSIADFFVFNICGDEKSPHICYVFKVSYL